MKKKALKKKVIVSTMAASLLFGTAAGLPLSSKGVLERLGMGDLVQVANAADLPAPAAELKARLTALYGVMTQPEKDKISAARDQIKEIIAQQGNTNWVDQYGSIIDPIWDEIKGKIQAKTGVSTSEQWQHVTKKNVLLFVLSFAAITYDQDFSKLEALRTDPVIRPIMNDLAILGGLQNGVNDLTFEDLTRFSEHMDEALKSTVLNIKNFDDVLNLETNLKNAVQAVIDARATKMAQFLDNMNFPASDILAIKNNLATKVSSANDAINAFIAAYVRLITPPPSSGGGNTGGGTTTPPAPVIVELPSAGQTLTNVQNDLNSLRQQLANATGEAAEQLREQAREKVEEAIKQLEKLDASKAISISNGVAQPQLNNTELLAAFRTVKQKIDQLNNALRALDPNAEPVEANIRLDFGNVNAASTKVTLSKELLDGAEALGIGGITVQVNGLSIGFDADEFDGSTELTINQLDPSVAQDATNLPLGSKVYDFGLKVGGQQVENFMDPIVVGVPLTNNQFDPDLLVLARIENGKLEFVGGTVENGVLIAERRHFSTYVVVQNKVTFRDTAEVRSWAGKFIDSVAAKGIVVGRGNDRFAPSANLTRAEFITMLVKTFDLKDAKATESFSDVGDGDWYKTFVASAEKYGLIKGRGDGIFDPNAKITRAEMAAMAAQALKSVRGVKDVKDVDAVLSKFNDGSSINSMYKGNVAIVMDKGIMVGDGHHNFNPNAHATRAQAAVVIYKLLQTK